MFASANQRSPARTGTTLPGGTSLNRATVTYSSVSANLVADRYPFGGLGLVNVPSGIQFLDVPCSGHRGGRRVAHGVRDLADVLAAQGRMPDAAAEYRLAIQADPNLYEAHLALGAVLIRTGNAKDARTHFEKAAQSPDPDIRAAALKALR